MKVKNKEFLESLKKEFIFKDIKMLSRLAMARRYWREHPGTTAKQISQKFGIDLQDAKDAVNYWEFRFGKKRK